MSSLDKAVETHLKNIQAKPGKSLAQLGTIMKKSGRSREQAVAELSRHNPQGRLVTPAEVANTVLWLCGAGASAITGQAIAVAGGEI